VAERRHSIPLPDGRTLAAVEDGDPAGAPVVVHHGTPGCRNLYAPRVRDAAARGIRLIAYDRAGYGDSDRHAGRAVADVAQDIAALADALGLERFGTWGASGGGPHALACAALLGGRCAAAATFAGAAPYGEPGLDFAAGMGEDNQREFAAALEGEAALRPLLEELAAGVRQATPEQLAEELRTLLSPPDAAAVTGDFAAHLHATFAGATRRGVDGWLDDDLAFTRPWGFSLADIAVPVQLWQGGQDLMVPRAHGEWLARHVPGAEVHISPGDGHFTVVEHHVGEVHAWVASQL
jgi:pimeloyl-ACP methyl ester carboxylesterase